MHSAEYAYGNWAIVVTMILVSLFFILRWIPMRTRLSKRSGGGPPSGPWRFAKNPGDRGA